MKKLNRKGYMTIEVVISSVIAFTVAFFLMELTMKLVNTVDDTYVDTQLITDKALIMKNIKENIENDIATNGKIVSVDEVEKIEDDRGNSVEWEIYFKNNENGCVVLNIGVDTIQYKNVDNEVVFTKNINSNLTNINPNIELIGDYLFIKIEQENIFSDKDYDINIMIYNG